MRTTRPTWTCSAPLPSFSLYNPEWPVYSLQLPLPPAKVCYGQQRRRGQRRQQPALHRLHRVRRHRRAVDHRLGRAHRGRRRDHGVDPPAGRPGRRPGPACTAASSTRTSTCRPATGWASRAASIHRSSPAPTRGSSSSTRTAPSTDRGASSALLGGSTGLSAQRAAVGTAPPWLGYQPGGRCHGDLSPFPQRARSAVSPEGAPRRQWCRCWWSTTSPRSAPPHAPS